MEYFESLCKTLHVNLFKTEITKMGFVDCKSRKNCERSRTGLANEN